MLQPIQAKVMQVIRVVHAVGTGIEGDPHRWITSYLTLEGKLLAEHDEWLEAKKDAAQNIPA